MNVDIRRYFRIENITLKSRKVTLFWYGYIVRGWMEETR